MDQPAPPVVRRRTPDDVAAVVDLLLAQQPVSRYPYRDPLPVPAEEFVVRPGQLDAWVAVLPAAAHHPDGSVVGHVGTTSVPDDEVGRVWSAALDRPVTALGAVTALVVDPAHTGRGLGGALLEAAERSLREAGLTPVLEVLGRNVAARRLYAARGWREVARRHPDWLPADEEPVCFLVLTDG